MRFFGDIYKIFIWCAGSDRQLLTQSPSFERTKHAGMGGLVLVPAVLGFISMSYAAKTIPYIRELPYLNYLFGLGWGCIVFLFDRYIVSTFRKSDFIKDDFKGLIFLSRAAFSIVVGFIIAHPLVLGMFAERIEREFILQKNQEEVQIRNKFSKRSESYEAKIQAIKKERSDREDAVAQAEQGYLTELNGIYGKGSGKYGDGQVAKRKKEILERKLLERDNHRTDTEHQIKVLDKNLTNLRQQMVEEIAQIHIPTDYLAREETLANLAGVHPVIRNRKYMWIVLFVFVDLLPILFKLAAKKEAYDVLLEETNKRSIAEIHNFDEVFDDYLSKKKSEYKNKVRKGSIDSIPPLWGFQNRDLQPEPAQMEASSLNIDPGETPRQQEKQTKPSHAIYIIILLGLLISTAAMVSLYVFKEVIRMSPSEQNAANAAFAAAAVATSIVGVGASSFNKKLSLKLTRSH